MLRTLVELGALRGERTPWASTGRTCQQLVKVAAGCGTFLEIKGNKPNNNAAKRALRETVIQRGISGLPNSSHVFISPWCHLRQPTAKRQLHAATTGPRCLAVLEASLACSSPRWGDAIPAAGCLREAGSSRCLWSFGDERSGIHVCGRASRTMKWLRMNSSPAQSRNGYDAQTGEYEDPTDDPDLPHLGQGECLRGAAAPRPLWEEARRWEAPEASGDWGSAE